MQYAVRSYQIVIVTVSLLINFNFGPSAPVAEVAAGSKVTCPIVFRLTRKSHAKYLKLKQVFQSRHVIVKSHTGNE